MSALFKKLGNQLLLKNKVNKKTNDDHVRPRAASISTHKNIIIEHLNTSESFRKECFIKQVMIEKNHAQTDMNLERIKEELRNLNSESNTFLQSIHQLNQEIAVEKTRQNFYNVHASTENLYASSSDQSDDSEEEPDFGYEDIPTFQKKISTVSMPLESDIRRRQSEASFDSYNNFKSKMTDFTTSFSEDVFRTISLRGVSLC